MAKERSKLLGVGAGDTEDLLEKGEEKGGLQGPLWPVSGEL